MILRGEGGYFCAGGDLNTLVKRREMTVPERRDNIEKLHNLVRQMRGCLKPVIAAVEGGAAGAGVSLALACDFLVAEQQAQFTLAYVKVGWCLMAEQRHRSHACYPGSCSQKCASWDSLFLRSGYISWV